MHIWSNQDQPSANTKKNCDSKEVKQVKHSPISEEETCRVCVQNKHETLKKAHDYLRSFRVLKKQIYWFDHKVSTDKHVQIAVTIFYRAKNFK